jgi:hypothetical protein
MPDLESHSGNYNFLIPLSLGVQFTAMNYQTKDVDLDQYNIFFSSGYGESTSTSSSNSNNTSAVVDLTGGHVSYVKKPDTMIEMA